MKLKFSLSFAGLALATFIAFKLGYNVQLFVLLAAALAVKHMAYVLLVGNIFQPLRTWIQDQEQIRWQSQYRWLFFRKLRVLFSCNLCMCTQLALWTVAVPASYLAHKRYGHILRGIAGGQLPWGTEWPLTALATFLFAMFVAGMAMAIWRVTEFPQEYAERMAQMREQELFNQLAATVQTSDPVLLEDVVERFGYENLFEFLRRLHDDCEEATFCSIVLGGCIMRNRPRIIRELTEAAGLNQAELTALIIAVRELSMAYGAEMYRELNDDSRYAAIRRQMASQFMDNPYHFAK